MRFLNAARDGCAPEWIVHTCKAGSECSRVIGRERGKPRIGVSLESAPVPHFVIDLDNVDRKCFGGKEVGDYIIFADDERGKVGWIVPVEISHGKNKKAGKIENQVVSSANAAAERIENGMTAEVVLIFVGQTRFAKELRRRAVKVFGNTCFVNVLRTGDSIEDAFNQVLNP